MSLYIFSVWMHVLLACVWVGGLIYTGAVVVPFSVRQSPAERQRILRGLARKFRMIGWTSIILLVVSGLFNATQRYGLESAGQIFSALKREDLSPLRHKLELFVVMVILMLIHDITSISAAKKYENRDSAPGNTLGSIAAAIATLLAIGILYFSVRIVRG
jgi:uncharacterized membrane protein